MSGTNCGYRGHPSLRGSDLETELWCMPNSRRKRVKCQTSSWTSCIFPGRFRSIGNQTRQCLALTGFRSEPKGVRGIPGPARRRKLFSGLGFSALVVDCLNRIHLVWSYVADWVGIGHRLCNPGGFFLYTVSCLQIIWPSGDRGHGFYDLRGGRRDSISKH